MRDPLEAAGDAIRIAIQAKAAEIERLRAALEEISDLYEVEYAPSIARRALYHDEQNGDGK